MIKLQAGLTPPFKCDYLPEREERLLCMPSQPGLNSAVFGELLAMGFRRSGEQVYAPRCEGCSACLALRIPVAHFAASSSQKRISRRNRHWLRVTGKPDWQRYWPVFDAFVTARHGDGGMYPPRFESMTGFLGCSWLPPRALELWDGENLVAVMIIDEVPDALSAVYTFFSPDYAEASPGVMAVLALIDLAREEQRRYAYLGYQVDDCRKMNYKRQFRPYEIFQEGQWHEYSDRAR